MEKFMGTPGNWDIDTDGGVILSDAGYIIASLDLIHGNSSDIAMMCASKAMFDVLTLMISAQVLPEYHQNAAQEAINKALGKE